MKPHFALLLVLVLLVLGLLGLKSKAVQKVLHETGKASTANTSISGIRRSKLEETSLNPGSAGGSREIRLLCWVLTCPPRLPVNGRAILETWGRRCNKLLFMTSEGDTSDVPGRVSLPGVREGRSEFVPKSREGWRYVWKNFKDEFDWFYKTDDDTYAVIENLKFALNGFPTDKPVFVGKPIRSGDLVYVSGGPGYAMNKRALASLAEGIENGCMRKEIVKHEDQLVSMCLRMAGVSLTNARDTRGRNKFMILSPDLHLSLGAIAGTDYRWIFERALPAKPGGKDILEGANCCSDLPISFHYIKPTMQRALEYLIYRVQVAGAGT